MAGTESARRRWIMRLAGAGIIGAVMALAALAVHAPVAERLRDEATAAARLRVETLESILAKQRAVAAILADDTAVRDDLGQGAAADHAVVSRKLNRLRDETQSAVIYLLDAEGMAVAASNWDQPDSFVGSNYGFRGYFQGALRDGTALEFALGTVSHRPGLYLSHAVTQAGQVLGVIVVKVEFDAVESAWAASRDTTWVTDGAGQVLLSSRTGDRFAPQPPVPADQIAVTQTVPSPGWQLVLAVPVAPARQAAALASGAAGSLAALALLGFGRWRRARVRAAARGAEEARRRAELEAAVADRTRALRDEIAERTRAEARLAGLQADLVQANKLATLGQVTAGLAHEVNQPLATIRLLAENAQVLLPKRAPADVADNLSAIVRMSERIGQITTGLRGFARKATGETAAVALRPVIEASVLLTASRRHEVGARIELPDIGPELTVMVEAVRLEQVLVNLIQNAQEALAGRPDPCIRISVAVQGDRAEVAVSDNGPGLGAVADRLFTPFATTRPGGLGLGLVIAQEIVRDFGGELRADPPQPGQGATFRFDLKRGPA
ncbi:sensor histidine kinase [Neotabrizicola sp. VNH66]|uniref:sensor histidine kinase n=1 Tax=Neotabrizicola sp. VNH66 TaxID=3400918 RepID=UPI003BFB4534